MTPGEAYAGCVSAVELASREIGIAYRDAGGTARLALWHPDGRWTDEPVAAIGFTCPALAADHWVNEAAGGSSIGQFVMAFRDMQGRLALARRTRPGTWTTEVIGPIWNDHPAQGGRAAAKRLRVGRRRGRSPRPPVVADRTGAGGDPPEGWAYETIAPPSGVTGGIRDLVLHVFDRVRVAFVVANRNLYLATANRTLPLPVFHPLRPCLSRARAPPRPAVRHPRPAPASLRRRPRLRRVHLRS